MQFTILNESEYQAFYDQVECQNFLQSKAMYKRYLKQNIESYLVGVKENDCVVASCLIVASKQKILGYKVFKAHRGPLLDYHNQELLTFFLEQINIFLKKKKGIFFYISPYIPKTIRDSLGNVIKEENQDVINTLNNQKLKYVGEYDQVDYMYVLDTNKDKQTLFNNYKPNTKNNINKSLNRYLLEIKKYSYEELSEFKNICDMASSKHDFSKQPLSYYQSMYEIFQNQVMFLGAKLVREKYLNILNKELENTRHNYEDCSNDKKRKMYEDNIKSLEKEIKDALELPKEVVIAVGMFILDKKEIIYLFSGCDDKYNKYNGSYFIQNYIINYASDNNYPLYNFYGVKRDINDGVYKFKRGFNGYIIETLGTYKIALNSLGNLINIIRK